MVYGMVCILGKYDLMNTGYTNKSFIFKFVAIQVYGLKT